MESQGRAAGQRTVSSRPSGFRKPSINLQGAVEHALAAGINAGTGNFIGAAQSAGRLVSALVFEGPDPGALAYQLLWSALIDATLEWSSDHPDLQALSDANKKDFADTVEGVLQSMDVEIEPSLFDRPRQIPFLESYQDALTAWLILRGTPESAARAASNRLPYYFVYALDRYWVSHATQLEPIDEALQARTSKPVERERNWDQYARRLELDVVRPMHLEGVSLREVIQPSRGYWLDNASTERTRNPRSRRRSLGGDKHLVDVQRALRKWIEHPDPLFDLAGVGGGPGAGKTCLAKTLAASLAAERIHRVMYIPVRAMPSAIDDIGTAVTNFASHRARLGHDPLDHYDDAHRLVLIIDGLEDIWLKTDRDATAIAQFINSAHDLISELNSTDRRILRIVVLGRTSCLQAVENMLSSPGQLLWMLPFSIDFESLGHIGNLHELDLGQGHPDQLDQGADTDATPLMEQQPDQLLDVLTNYGLDWWAAYARATGRDVTHVLASLEAKHSNDLRQVPLICTLVGFKVLERGDPIGTLSNEDVDEIVLAIHERSWLPANERRHAGVGDLGAAEYGRLLQQMAAMEWQGEPRIEGAIAVVDSEQGSLVLRSLTPPPLSPAALVAAMDRLLASFFFAIEPAIPARSRFKIAFPVLLDYLVAGFVVQSSLDIMDRMDAANSPTEVARDSLRDWLAWCGSAQLNAKQLAFASSSIAKLSDAESDDLQHAVELLLNHALRLEVELDQHPVGTVLNTLRNGVTNLLALCSLCARRSGRKTHVDWSSDTAFGDLVMALRGQRHPDDGIPLVMEVLDRLVIGRAVLWAADLSDANLAGSDLRQADLRHCSLRSARLSGAQLGESKLDGADLTGAALPGATLHRASLTNTRLTKADLSDCNLREANLAYANLSEADLSNADLKGADLTGSVLKGSNLEGCMMDGWTKPSWSQLNLIPRTAWGF